MEDCLGYYLDTDLCKHAAGKDKAGGAKPGALKSVLEGLEDLWDENQYAEEFSLQSFTNKMAVSR